MSGDVAFEPDLQRTISVDIRYVLFIMILILTAPTRNVSVYPKPF